MVVVRAAGEPPTSLALCLVTFCASLPCLAYFLVLSQGCIQTNACHCCPGQGLCSATKAPMTLFSLPHRVQCVPPVSGPRAHRATLTCVCILALVLRRCCHRRLPMLLAPSPAWAYQIASRTCRIASLRATCTSARPRNALVRSDQAADVRY